MTASEMRRRLHWADHMVPCLQTPVVKGAALARIADLGPLVALGSFVRNCQSRPDDFAWCRAVLREAGVDLPTLLDDITHVAHLYDDPHDVPVQIFQSDPDDYALVPLGDLPYGGSMHSCGHQNYFEQQLRQLRRVPRLLRLPGAARTDSAERIEAGRRLTEAVARGELNVHSCPQHRDPIDWTKVNAVAEHVRTTIRPWTRNNVIEATSATSAFTTALSDAERTRLTNLFIDPIRWLPGAQEVDGGQHRLCGYRQSEASHAFVANGNL